MTNFVYFHKFYMRAMCNVFMMIEANFYSFTRQEVFMFDVKMFVFFLYVSFYFYFECIGFRHKWHIHFAHDKLYYRLLRCHCRHSPINLLKNEPKKKEKNCSRYQIWNRKNHNKPPSASICISNWCGCHKFSIRQIILIIIISHHKFGTTTNCKQWTFHRTETKYLKLVFQSSICVRTDCEVNKIHRLVSFGHCIRCT